MVKLASSQVIFNNVGNSCLLPPEDQRLAQKVRLKIAQKYGVCPATAGAIAHLAGLGPRGWR